MSIALVETAVRTRLIADATLTGYLAAGSSSVTAVFGAAVLAYPYVVYAVTDAEEADSFNADVVVCTIEVHVLDAAANGQVTCRNAIERIRGDATLQSSRTPTYGLHRHKLNLSDTYWTGGVIQRVGGSTEHERDVLHYVERYQVTAQRTAP